MNKLLNSPGERGKRIGSWSAAGDDAATTAVSAPPPAVTDDKGGFKWPCLTCQHKKLGCFIAGALAGAVITYLVTKKKAA